MKSKKIQLIVAVLGIFFLAGTLSAEEKTKWNNWGWEVFNLKFKLPSFVKITKQDSEVLSASDGKSFSINVFAWIKEGEKAQSIAQGSYDSYDVVKNKEIVTEHEVNMVNQGFDGYLIVGKGIAIKQNKGLWFAIFGMVDPKTKTSLLVSFAWWDEEEKNQYFSEICDKIAESFHIVSE